MSVTPFVSVIVPVYRDADGIRRCLAALRRQSYPADRYEVLVVDNGSEPPVELEPGEGPAVHLLVEPEPSSYAARNRGVRAARGEVLAFTDADCVPAADWLERGVAAVSRSGSSGVVGGRIELTFGDERRKTAAELLEQAIAFRQDQWVERLRFGATANVIVRREVFERVGPFDTGYQSGGDVEWGRRAHAAGSPVEYAAEVVVRHAARRTLAEIRRKRIRVVAGMWRLEPDRARNRRLIYRLLLPPVRTMRELARAGRLPPGSWDRLRFAAALTFFRWVESGERLRLALGRRPRGWR
jgi:GT2 family glycosyltransferase